MDKDNYNVYELAICFDAGYDDVKTYEYTKPKKMFADLNYILQHDLYQEANRIELSVLERNKFTGEENNNTYTFATFDISEWNKRSNNE